VSYRRALLTGWSRRDRLAVVVVATITAVLVGTTLIVVATGSVTTELARGQSVGTPGHVTTVDDPTRARSIAGLDDRVLPVAEASVGNRTVTVVGLPGTGNTTPTETAFQPPPPGGAVRGPGPGDRTARLSGRSGAVNVTVVNATGDPFPRWWYAASVDTVESLGPTRALVVSPSEPPRGGSERSVPLVGALTFFVRGSRQLLAGIGVLAGSIGVLTGVVVFSVTRMTIQDRVTTLAVLRATGLPRRRVLALFAGRASLLAGVAVFVGAAAGVVVTNAAVNAAVFVGLPTTLSLQVTPQVLRVLVPGLLGVVVVGVGAGVAATVPTVRKSPAALHRRTSGPSAGDPRDSDGWLGRVRPEFLGARAVVPTAATLSVFVAVTLLATTAGATVAPLASTDDATVVQSGATHPWASRIDADYAAAIREEGVTASPEVLAFSVVDGEPFLTRGAKFEAFARLSDASVVRGRPPTARDEAVVGHDLAATLDVSVGDRLPLGGSDRPAVTIVRVVGVYRAPGFADDQLVVPLSTARHLSRTGPGTVNMIRVSRPVDAVDSRDGTGNGGEAHGVAVVDLATPGTVTHGERVRVNVTLENADGGPRTERVVVAFDGERRAQEVSLGSGERRTLSVAFDSRSPGTYRVRAGNATGNVTVLASDALQFAPLPARGPPGEGLVVRVTDAEGTPVNATVRVATDREETTVAATGGDGMATVTLPSTGIAQVRATAPGYRNATARVVVDQNATRQYKGRLSVSPSRPRAFERPRATLALRNPWNVTLSRRVTIRGPRGNETIDVTLGPGGEQTVTRTLGRAGTGAHVVRAVGDGRPIARTTYVVTGDERVVSAIATGGETSVAASGLGQAASRAFGNLRVLLGTLVVLAALATVAATTAAFARTVHARRRGIGVHRATGATPRQVLQTVLGDAVRVAVPATLLALIAGYLAVRLLAAGGLLTAFGVTLVPSPSPSVVLGIGTGTLALALVAAGVATIGLLRVPPARLFDGRARRSDSPADAAQGGQPADGSPSERHAADRPGGGESDD